jgi:hypothetical protein
VISIDPEGKGSILPPRGTDVDIVTRKHMIRIKGKMASLKDINGDAVTIVISSR